MDQKIIKEQCIGYQNVASGTNTIYEQALENGEIQWQVIGYDKNNLPIHWPPTDQRPRIDIPQEAVK